jgi:HD-like signal output (HDOD) protein
MNRLLLWFRSRGRAPDESGLTAIDAPIARIAVPPSDPASAVPAAGAAAAPELQFFSWLTGEPPAEGAVNAAEQDLLAHLDTVTATDAQRAELVPRARAIIPQLMNSLRDDTQSAQALTARVARDPNLVVEVLRLASSIGYGTGTPVVDLSQAVGRLGTEGLRRAIARILLKPIFDAQADPLLGRTAERLWQHSEGTANLCLQTAAIARVEPFDAYLAGLMYNVGWTAAFRALDRSTSGAPAIMSASFVHLLGQLRDRLFAHLVQSWALSDSLSALGAEMLAVGFANTQLPLGTLLRSADRAAFLQLRRATATAP